MKTIKDYDFFKILKESKLLRFPSAAEFHFKNIYKEIDFTNKRVLDIGAGQGLHSIFASFCGAKKVIAVEPEANGSENGYLKKFEKNLNIFGRKNVFLFPGTFQELVMSEGDKFDLIISHYSINHLDEDSCIKLSDNMKAWENYTEIFRKIHKLSSQDARFIIVDCSNRNLFYKIGIKNPFAPTIEWNKHQPPEIWIKLLQEAGFRHHKLNWLFPAQLGNFGKYFLSNKLGSFLTHSHYMITSGADNE